MNQPLVSIIMPAYNREKFIAESIHSIIFQTYKNWELIIVDDGSDDQTVKVVGFICDPRIQLICSKVNKGVSFALNIGILKAKGKYIARHDSDDISKPNRFEIQVNVLENNLNIDICGAWMKTMGKGTLLKYPKNHNVIMANLLLKNPMASPTILCRRDVFDKFKFDQSLRFGEDYDLLSKALFCFKAYNIPLVLTEYRQHKNQLTKIPLENQIFIDFNIQLYILDKFEYDKSFFSNEFLKLCMVFKNVTSIIEASKYLNFLNILIAQNAKLKIIPNSEFKNVISILKNSLIEKVFFHRNPKINKTDRITFWLKLDIEEKIYVLKNKIK